MKKSILLLACIAALTSCTVTQKTAVTAPVTDVVVKQYPTVADLKVKPQKVERTETWPFVPFNWGQPSMKVRKGNMVADMLAENGADVLLEPQTVFTKRFLGPRKLTITGYAATFSNFRKATKEDLEALDMDVPAHEKTVYNVAQPETAVAMGETDTSNAPSKKAEWKVSAGWTANEAKGGEGYSGKFGRQSGYMVDVEYRKPIKYGVFWGMKGGFWGRGYQYEEGWSERSAMLHVLKVQPLNFGYKYDLGKNLTVTAHLGAYFDVLIYNAVQTTSSNLEYFSNYADDRCDIGIEFGLGVEIRHWALDFNIDRGFRERMSDHLSMDGIHQRSVSLSLGYVF